MNRKDFFRDISQLIRDLENTDHSTVARVEERKLGKGKDAPVVKTEYAFHAKAGLPDKEEIRMMINDQQNNERLR
ncbi:hypothetical protein [Evansella clarkii]|uniref:hypothetical protein n=1 Tax=Evansella clarkii TaxID=79879 RepID=UPI00099886CE|nr:hypothetical protein [Evansella clarkii]